MHPKFYANYLQVGTKHLGFVALSVHHCTDKRHVSGESELGSGPAIDLVQKSLVKKGFPGFFAENLPGEANPHTFHVLAAHPRMR